MPVTRVHCPVCEAAYEISAEFAATRSRMRCEQCGLHFVPFLASPAMPRRSSRLAPAPPAVIPMKPTPHDAVPEAAPPDAGTIPFLIEPAPGNVAEPPKAAPPMPDAPNPRPPCCFAKIVGGRAICFTVVAVRSHGVHQVVGHVDARQRAIE